MASDESYLERFEEDDGNLLVDLVKLQALIRGKLVRKQMMEIQYLYEEIVHDVEGPEMEVVWSGGNLPLPTVRKIKMTKSNLELQRVSDTSASCTFAKNLSNKSHSHVSQIYPTKNLARDNSPTETALSANLVLGFVSTQVQTDSGFPVSERLEQNVPGNDISSSTHNPQWGDDHPNCENGVAQSSKAAEQEFQIDDLAMEVSHEQIADGAVRSLSVIGNSVENSSGKPLVLQQQQLSIEHSDHYSDDFISEDLEEAEDTEGEDNDAIKQPSNDMIEKNSEEEENRSLEEHPVKEDKSDSTTKSTAGASEALNLPDDKNQLLQLKNTMAMELLWVQQAINSRKHYLRLKQQLQ